MIETVVTTLVDTFPRMRKRKPMILVGICTLMFVTGIFLCYQGGIYILQLMDNYCASFSALIIGLVEVIAIAWVYGADRFLDDCKMMLGSYPYTRGYWKFIWKFVCPLLILVSSLSHFGSLFLQVKLVSPKWRPIEALV